MRPEAKPSDYVFSTPVMSVESPPRPTFLVTLASRGTDYSMDISMEGFESFPLFKILRQTDGGMVEAMENIYQSQKEMSCDEVRKLLLEWGLVHQPALDPILADFQYFFDRNF